MWIRNFELALDNFPVVILHGNVRDSYIAEDGAVYRNLTQLFNSTVRRMGVFDEVLVYSGTLERGQGTRTALNISGDAATPTQTSDGPLPLQRLRPAIDNSKLPDQPNIMFETLNREFREPTPRRVGLINYLDKIVQFHQGGPSDPAERECLYYLERAIENMHSSNRLVLVALTDSRVPIELYQNSPSVRLFEIPLPDTAERVSHVRSKLPRLDEDSIREIADTAAGMYIGQLTQVAEDLAERDASTLNSREIRETVNRIRIGIRKDYWAELSIKDLDDAMRRVGKSREDQALLDQGTPASSKAKAFDQVKGQDPAVLRVLESLLLARSGLVGVSSGRSSKPRGVLLFAGPSGVGKTLLAKRMAYFLFGSDEAFIRLDMSEFKEEHSVSKLIGSPPGYVGFERGGALTNAVREKPFSVVLFDEVEKAHTKILDVFLQVLDDGRLTDSRGQVTFFSEAIIVLTTNIGTRKRDSRDHECSERDNLEAIFKDGALSDEDRRAHIAAHFTTSVEDFFRFEISRPELLNRIGSRIVPFSFIEGQNVQRSIVLEQFDSLTTIFEDKYRDRGYCVSIGPEIADHLVAKHGKRLGEFGGRGVANAVEDEINVPLAKTVLVHEYKNARGVRFTAQISGGKISFSSAGGD